MKRSLPAVVIIVVVVFAGTWLFTNLRGKRSYARVRDEVVRNSASVKPMDDDTKALLAKARAEWHEVYSKVGWVHSNGLKAVGLRPLVADLVEVCAYQMPEYSFTSPKQNERAVVLSTLQLTILAASTDKTLYVSADVHLAVMRHGTSCISVFSDEDGGLRETVYSVKAKDSEPKREGGEDGLRTPPRK